MVALWQSYLTMSVCTSSDCDQSSVVSSVAIVGSMRCCFVDWNRFSDFWMDDRQMRINDTL
jgi:hypothetical protein